MRCHLALSFIRPDIELPQASGSSRIDANPLSGDPRAFRRKTLFREETALHPKTAPNRSGTSDWSAEYRNSSPQMVVARGARNHAENAAQSHSGGAGVCEKRSHQRGLYLLVRSVQER